MEDETIQPQDAMFAYRNIDGKPVNRELPKMELENMQTSVQKVATDKKNAPSTLLIGLLNNTDAIFEPYIDRRIKTKDYTIDQSEVYKTLNDGTLTAMYPDYIKGTDNNERLAQNQSGWEQTINGLSKAGINTGSVVLGNTAGFVYGLTDWAKTGNFNSVFDNSFSKTLDDWNTKLGFQLPNYYTKQEKEAGFFGSLVENPANFIANDLFNGISFTLGTIVSEGIWAYATGGASLAVRAGRIGAKLGQIGRGAKEFTSAVRAGETLAGAGKFGKAILGTEKVADGLANYKGIVYQALDNAVATGKMNKGLANAFAKGGEILNTTRFIGTSSGNEAGIEAFHFKKEATENFYRNFEELNGRPPTAEESIEMLNKIEGAANNVFASNMAILGVSNLAMLGGMFNLKSPISGLQKAVNQKLFGIGVKEASVGGELVFKGLERKAWQKGAGYLYKGSAPIVREGMFEEGLQGATTKTANHWIERQYDPKYLNKVMSLGDDAWKAMGEQYGTKAGWKEIGIGGLVGIVGGVVTGEFSQFAEMETQQREVVAKSLNAANVTMKTFVSDINAGRMMTTAKIMESEDRAERAMAKKDVVSAKLAHNDSMIALAEMYDNPLYGTGGFSQMERHGNNMIDTTEVSEEEKNELKAGFKSFINEYKSASTFANSIVGSQGKVYGTDFQANDVKKALTYTILQGQSSKKMMDESLTDFGNLIGKDYQQAIQRNEELQTLDVKTRGEFNSLAKEKEALEKRSEKLQEQIQLEQISVKEGRESRVPLLQREILEIEKRKQEVNASLETIASKIATNKKLEQSFKGVDDINMVDEFISVDELLRVEKDIDKLEEAYKTLKSINPISAQMATEHMANYKKAQQALLDHNTAIKLIASGNFKPRLTGLNPFSGLYDKFSKGEIDKEDHTSEFLTRLGKIRNTYTASVAGEGQKKEVERAQVKLDELNALETLTEEQVAEKARLEKLIVDLSPKAEEVVEEKNDTPKRKETETPKELTTVEALKARIEDILKLFKSSFIGTYDVDEAVKKRPDQKDVDRYTELKNNPIIKNFEVQKTFDVNLVSGKDRVLLEEFTALKEKLSQWRVYDSLAEDEQSVADLLNIVAQLETEVEEINTLSEPNVEDVFTEAKLKPSETVDLYDLSVNTNFPVTVKREANGRYTITHMHPSSLLTRLGATEVKIKDKAVTFKGVDDTKKKGVVVKFMSGGVAREFTVEDRGRLSIAAEDFNAIPNVRTIESLSSWSYPNLYERDFEGKWKPIGSDFGDGTITGDSFKLKEGDIIELVVDVNNEHNIKLLSQKLTAEELANQVVIYIKKNGKNYGTIKGIPKRDEAFKASEHSILKLRDLAGEMLTKGKSGVVATSTVTYVQLGNPILSINGDGKIAQNEFTESAIKNVEATGYVLDGEIVLNNKTKVDEVRRSYIKKIAEKNKGKKVPIVVIKRESQLIAFPVSMIKRPAPKTDDLNAILNDSQLTDAEKVSAINNLLIANGIAPKEFNLITLNEEKVNAIAEKLEANQDYLTAEQLANNYEIKNLVNDATIALDLENIDVSLPSQKFNIDMEGISFENLPEVKIEPQATLEKVVEKADQTSITTAQNEDVAPKVKSARNQVNNTKTAAKSKTPHTMEFQIEPNQLKSLPKGLVTIINRQSAKLKIVNYSEKYLLALEKAGVRVDERNVPKTAVESKVDDVAEIATSAVNKFIPLEINEDNIEDVIVDEMNTSIEELKQIAKKIVSSGLTLEEYVEITEDAVEKQAILADVGIVGGAVTELEQKPKVEGTNKLIVKRERAKEEEEVSTVNLLSFETADLTGTKVTYYKRGDKWGYIDKKGRFDSLVLNAQPRVEKAYQAYKESIMTETEEQC